MLPAMAAGIGPGHVTSFPLPLPQYAFYQTILVGVLQTGVTFIYRKVLG